MALIGRDVESLDYIGAPGRSQKRMRLLCAHSAISNAAEHEAGDMEHLTEPVAFNVGLANVKRRQTARQNDCVQGPFHPISVTP